MALFTDPEIFTIDDLSAQETAILDTAVTEGIDLTSKLGLAQNEIGVELLATFERRRAYDAQAPLQLSNVVVTAPLRLWHTFHTLAMVYRDAYNNQLNDRYEGKWNQYRELARWASGALLQIGVGIVWNPLEQPGAAELTYVAGSQPGATYYVRISWVNARGEESASGLLSS